MLDEVADRARLMRLPMVRLRRYSCDADDVAEADVVEGDGYDDDDDVVDDDDDEEDDDDGDDNEGDDDVDEPLCLRYHYTSLLSLPLYCPSRESAPPSPPDRCPHCAAHHASRRRGLTNRVLADVLRGYRGGYVMRVTRATRLMTANGRGGRRH